MFTISKHCQYMCDGKLKPVTESVGKLKPVSESVGKLKTDNTCVMVS